MNGFAILLLVLFSLAAAGIFRCFGHPTNHRLRTGLQKVEAAVTAIVIVAWAIGSLVLTATVASR